MDRRAVLAFGVASAAATPGLTAWGGDFVTPANAARTSAVKLIAIYDRPDDPEAFFKHYESVHAPLVKKTPGLQSFVLNRVTEDCSAVSRRTR